MIHLALAVHSSSFLCRVHSSPLSLPCSAWLCLLYVLRFHSATTVRLPYVSLLFHSMAMLDARLYLMLLDTGMF